MGRSLSGILILGTVLLYAFICPPHALSAQEKSLDEIDVLLQSPEFSGYRGEADQILKLFHDLKASGLPSVPLVDLLREGAAKHVAPDVLYGALKKSAERIRVSARILQQTHLWPEGLKPAEVRRRIELVRRVGLVVQGGVPEILLTSLMSGSPRPEKGLRLAEALVGILQVADVPEADLLAMSNTILGGRLPEATYSSLPGLFVRGRVLGLSGEGIARIITRIASRGGGIIQMDAEIRRQGGQP